LDSVQLVDLQASKIKLEEIKLRIGEEEVPGPLTLELVQHFSNKINQLAASTYGRGSVAAAAFREYATQTIMKGSESFLFNKQHWKSNRSIGPYISKCLTKLSFSLKSDLDFHKKITVPICPACKTLNQREFLESRGKILFCKCCSNEGDRLGDIKQRTAFEEYEYRIRKIFSLHSRGGYGCPDCGRFIPESYICGDRVSCPYDNCSWFGNIENLLPMSHPKGQTIRQVFSTDYKNDNGDGSGRSFGETLDSKSISPDAFLEARQKYQKEFNIAKEVIMLQSIKYSKNKDINSLKKKMMYKAFDVLLEDDPAGMMNYLIHGKSIGERPIQSTIFQKYIEIIENLLPLKVINEYGKSDEAFSLLDPGLDLFLGTSKFVGAVRESGIVTNNTHEVYTGEKCKGPCFIGLLCDVQDSNGVSLLSEVEYYTFSIIKLKQTIKENTLVTVTHNRIPPHYEQYSLVNLQRTRRKLVDSIYKRLNGEQRPLKGVVSNVGTN
jgi:hypothetical protein